MLSDVTVLKSGAATVLLEDSEREALEGELLRLADEEGRTFFPRAPEHEVKGVIISLFDAISRIGQHQVAALSVARATVSKKAMCWPCTRPAA
ncbi:MAG: hypothetical protein M3294_00755 [Pseudomonadota bacterium]|nr:hypothetical protein [Pseudomonadota bacterium]